MHTEKKERPILFSGPLVRAILAGEKTQTRRLIHPRRAIVAHHVPPADPRDAFGQPPPDPAASGVTWGHFAEHYELVNGRTVWPSDVLPDVGAYPVSTLLWVRETWGEAPPPEPQTVANGFPIYYAADDSTAVIPWHRLPVGGYKLPQSIRNGGMAPSIYMPRWASRITLRVTSVRLERLQGITDADIRAEGIVHAGFVDEGQSLRDAWAKGWDGINGGRDKPERPALWACNPWVIVYGFERVEAGR